MWFVGLQGSYGRGEATETSDMDIVVILDTLSVADMQAYHVMLDTLPHRELICGFLSGKDEMRSVSKATGNKSAPEGKISFGGTGQDLLLGLNRRATRKPKKMAAVIPPAAAVSPPVKAPATPRSSTAFATPCARV